MSIYTVDVYSGSSDSIIRDSHAQGVIVKATQGTGYVNPLCNHQWDLAGSLNKLRGLYHYAGGGNPESEAQYFINNIKNYIGKGILILDWESYQNVSWGNTSWAYRFVNEVHRLTGVWPLIYVQESALWQVANCASICGVWVAKYASMNWNSWVLPNMNVSHGAFAALTGWQYTGGDMDRSIFFINAAEWNRLANPAGNSGWQGSGDNWQYYEKGTAVKSDWHKIDGKWFHFDSNGNVQTGWQKINDHWYFFNDKHDGTYGCALTSWQKINDKWYYMDPQNAWCLTGWNQINKRWYYMDKDNAWCVTGWQTIDGKKYYFDPENAWMLTGKQKIDGKEYTFNDNGALQDQSPEQKPVVPAPGVDAKSGLSISDRKLIEEELKPYINEEIKAQLSGK